MAEFPALPLWTDAYLGDTTHLTTVEHGAYLLLLMTMWRTSDCRLPDDDKLLARYARCNAPNWKKLRPILEPFFCIKDGFFTQRRLLDEWNAVRKRRDAAAANGVASALKRKGRHSTEREQSDNKATNEASTDGQRESNLTITSTIPLSNDNGGTVDSDTQFWSSAKAYLGPSKASMIGKWLKEGHSKAEVASAISAAQVERAVNPVEFIQGRFRKVMAEGYGPGHSGIPL